jgi:site-specific DNA-methyltransferase (adenine-specific)
MRKYGGHRWDFHATARELYRVTKDGGIVCWVIGEAVKGDSFTGTSSEQRLFFRDLGFKLLDWLFIESHIGYQHRRHAYQNAIQQVFVLSKGSPSYVNRIKDRENKSAGKLVRASRVHPDGRREDYQLPRVYGPTRVRSNVWPIIVGNNKNTKDEVARGHPALMPEDLARDLIVSYSRPGELVFDPFLGAGTTARIAIVNHRAYAGFEIHRPYYRKALKRIELAESELLEQLVGVDHAA